MRRVDGVVLDGQDVVVAALLVRIGAAYLLRVNGSVPPGALRLRDELNAFAARETASAEASAGRESAKADISPTVAESAPKVTVKDAARILGISEQAVTARCRSGALTAVRSAAGHWQINAESAQAVAARRKGG